jgi:hypothetical protein
MPNGHKIYQHRPFSRPSKIYQNWDFWLENTPSGNPGDMYVCKARVCGGAIFITAFIRKSLLRQKLPFAGIGTFQRSTNYNYVQQICIDQRH